MADSLIFLSPLEKLKNDEVKESEEPIKKSTGMPKTVQNSKRWK